MYSVLKKIYIYIFYTNNRIPWLCQTKPWWPAADAAVAVVGSTAGTGPGCTENGIVNIQL